MCAGCFFGALVVVLVRWLVFWYASLLVFGALWLGFVASVIFGYICFIEQFFLLEVAQKTVLFES